MQDNQLDTFAKLLLWNYQKYGDKRVAMRRKHHGIWNEYTWKDYYHEVKHFSLGLVSLGLQEGDKVSIIGDNDPEYYWAILASQAAGGISVGIFTDVMREELKYFIQHSDSAFIVAHDQEQVDKVLTIKDEIPKVIKIIYWDPKGLWFYEDDLLMSFDQVLDIGTKFEESHPNVFEENVKKRRGEDVACFCYTSGTTALPKAAMLTCKGLLRGFELLCSVDPLGEKENYVSIIPPAWAAEYMYGLAGNLTGGMIVNFPEKPETVQQDLREIGPESIFYAARVWENVASQTQLNITDSYFLARFIYRQALRIGYKRTERGFGKRKRDVFLKILIWLADFTTLKPLRDRLGLSKIRRAVSAGAFLSGDTFNYIRALGINVRQGYAVTELMPITQHRDGDVRFETIGQLLPGIKMRITEDGEMVFRGDHHFAGYYKNPDETAKIMKDGEIHTGDAGHIDEDGHLIYWDRVLDLLELGEGKRFSPQYIEGSLKFSPYIKEAVTFGGKDKPYVTAIINMDYGNVGRWAEKRKIEYTTFADLSQRPEIYDLLQKDVERVNSRLPEYAKVKKFVSLPKELDADEAEITRTRKLRRRYLESRFESLVRALYGDGTEGYFEMSVSYRDGRKGFVKSPIKIRTVY